jgi:hypothetical protein
MTTSSVDDESGPPVSSMAQGTHCEGQQ